ncbi:MAG: FtsX-like permease family protein [Bryobacteraceae bacterium]
MLGVRLLDELKADLRYALRSMRHNKAFTAVIVGCLALGIGANTAIFSVVNAVLLQMLPVKNPQLGRDIDERDIETHRRVAIVNETFAKYFYGASNPLGYRFNFGDSPDPAHEFEIVGVVQDARDESLRDKPRPAFYAPFTAGDFGPLAFEIRTAREPQAFIPAIRKAVHSVDPRLPLVHVTTENVVLDQNLQHEHTLADLSSLFGALALLLASIGLYGNLAYAVTRRTNEIGIRMALGADRTTVLWMILRESLLLIAAGIAVGLPLALAAARLIQSMLYGVRFFDPAILAAAILVLASAGALAAFLPARRASRIDPLTALRYE